MKVQTEVQLPARFVPMVRTVINPLAGSLGVPGRTSTLWQAVGGLAWSVGVAVTGYGLGSSVDNIDRYLLPIIAAAVVISLVPLGVEALRARQQCRADAPAGTRDR